MICPTERRAHALSRGIDDSLALKMKRERSSQIALAGMYIADGELGTPAPFLLRAKEVGMLLDKANRAPADPGAPARTPTPDDVRFNTLANAKRRRGGSPDPAGCEAGASAEKRPRRAASVRFESVVRVRVQVGAGQHRRHDIAGVQAEQDEEPAGRVCCQADYEVQTKMADGPDLVSQVVSNLLVAVVEHDADVSQSDRVPSVLYGHSQQKGDGLEQVEVQSLLLTDNTALCCVATKGDKGLGETWSLYRERHKLF